MAATAYERRLLATNDLVLSVDGKSQLPRLSSADLGVTADLKSHQLDGVHWLIRRYHLGGNDLLDQGVGLSLTHAPDPEHPAPASSCLIPAVGAPDQSPGYPGSVPPRPGLAPRHPTPRRPPPLRRTPGDPSTAPMPPQAKRNGRRGRRAQGLEEQAAAAAEAARGLRDVVAALAACRTTDEDALRRRAVALDADVRRLQGSVAPLDPAALDKADAGVDGDAPAMIAGCHFTRELAKTAGHVLAMDFIESVIKKNESINGHYENASFMCADVICPDLVIEDNSIDLVFSIWLLMYLSDEEDDLKHREEVEDRTEE
ncbi:hypothetical protein ZWY2020_021678 [Hordeum vulgare]|nr:hypothetical protein ZWY2020_021678 [Hordeum vulgare]